MIVIKPHHFIDIVKLYGSGIENFVPDEEHQHDFYKVANEITRNLNTELKFTVHGDDICKPCNRFNGASCTDPLEKIAGYQEKEVYNRTLDQRIADLLGMNLEEGCTAGQFLEELSRHPKLIVQVWTEEDDAVTTRRNELFWVGCKKLLDKQEH